jgi:acryloyl-coenzyme A reductase
MKAIVVHEPGGVEVLKLETVEDPTPGRNDVIIEVEACGVCFHDIVTRNGTLRQGIRMPVILGHEIAGTVAAVGSDVSHFKPGDRVATSQRSHICGACEYCRTGHEQLCPERQLVGDWGLNGGYAEYVAVEDDNVALVPADVSLREASIVACTIGTILNALRDIASVRMGETVLVTGAGGGLGMHAVQLARLAGAVVVAQTTSASKVDAIRKAGAHAVVVHERGADFSADVKKATGGRGVDVAVDNVGSALFTPIRRSMAPRGRWLLIGQLTGEFVPFNPAQLFLKGISMLSATSSTRKQIQDCLGLVARGDVRPVISHALPLEEAARAHTEVESGAITGRIVLCPSGIK